MSTNITTSVRGRSKFNSEFLPLYAEAARVEKSAHQCWIAAIILIVAHNTNNCNRFLHVKASSASPTPFWSIAYGLG